MGLQGPLIGGLPAEDFIKRLVKVRWDDGDAQPSVCTVDGITRKGKVLIRVNGGRGAGTVREVSDKAVMPFWSQNPDLKEKADALKDIGPSAEVQPDDGDEEASETVPFTKSVEAVPAHNGKMLGKVEVDFSMGTEWMEPYANLQKVVTGLAAREAEIARLQAELDSERELIPLYVEELEAKGVKVQWI